jgi:threonine aldolase
MGNLISLMVNVRTKGEGAIIGDRAHVYCIERGGMSAIGSIHPIVVKN